VPDYFAPLEDMRFVVKELCQLKDVLSIPVFKEREIDVDMVDAIFEEGGKFANEVLAPINASGDVEGNKFNLIKGMSLRLPVLRKRINSSQKLVGQVPNLSRNTVDKVYPPRFLHR